jgi:hypothetical protein
MAGRAESRGTPEKLHFFRPYCYLFDIYGFSTVTPTVTVSVTVKMFMRI